MNLPIGYLLQKGKYKLKEVIGQGGFGITYKGIWYTEVKGSLGAMRTEVPVCIKEYFFKDYCVRDAQTNSVQVHSDTGKLLFDKFKEKLIKEAKILSDVHHPYIVNVLEVFEENNTAYIAMEYIAGYSLKEKLAKEGALKESEVLKITHQIGQALLFVHQKNILHLDVKPSNIILDKDNNARLIDFGVSKRYDVGEQETSTTMLTLSKGFASIEQYDNEGIQTFSPCPDIYSLGATMYNLLTGRIPTESILRATRPLVKPSEINPAITAKTENVILKAMEIIPANRYQSIGEMLQELDGYLENSLETTNNTSKIQSDEQNEETTVLASAPPFSENNEDETIIDIPDSDDEKERKKKSPIAMVMALTAGLTVLGGGSYGLYYYYGNEDSETNIATEEKIASNIKPDLKEKAEKKTEKKAAANKNVTNFKPADKVEKKEIRNIPKEDKKETEQQIVAAEEKTKPSPVKEVLETTPQIEEKQQSSVSSIENTDEFYNRLLTSGKAKMKSKDYAGAKKDFSLAKDQMITEEVMRLIISCDEKMEELNISKKKALYEEKMAFGNFKIVRKKSNNKYGAIDEKGNEKIPCKYLSVGKTDTGRAFEREDNLYDIYASDGSLITKGATYY